MKSGPRPTASARPDTERIALPFIMFSCLLLTALTLDVAFRMPLKTMRDLEYWVPRHQSVWNVVIARKMVTGLLGSPPNMWLGPEACDEMQHGIWMAAGMVEIKSSSGRMIPVEWWAIFNPDRARPLYLAAGPRQQGDLAAALRQAGASRGIF